MSWAETVIALGVVACVGVLWEINLKIKAIHFMLKDAFDEKHGLND